ncbi:MAG: glycosyltransferase family 2 protein [Fuerstiella sp.]|jgi:glycosyltransferase involved in cell wall biosynthesis|nr:glycosyltransferase family 2 protein [Fuerstiella sp.]MCP4510352.1 glycosyltransferase family 2 protein [Fuerstiella sp.]
MMGQVARGPFKRLRHPENMGKPTVSVLTTTYNREKYVATAIESVLASTFNDFELIVVDDRSTDRSVEIAQRYASRDSRVRVVVNDENLGDYPNRNRAASLARGHYIKYVDADDYIYPGGLQTLVDMMRRFPDAGYGLCSLEQRRGQPYPFEMSPQQAYESHFCHSSLFHKAPLSAIILKRAYEAVGGFPERRMSSDFEMWLRLSQQHNVVLMPGGIVWYREHDAQEINSYQKFVCQYQSIKFKYLQDSRCPLDAVIRKRVIRNERRRARKQALMYLVRGRPAEAVQMSEAAGLCFTDLLSLPLDLAAHPFRHFFAGEVPVGAS